MHHGINFAGDQKQFEKKTFKSSVVTIIFRYEAAHVRECLMANQLESDLMPHKTSRRIMGYLDEIRKQICTQR